MQYRKYTVEEIKLLRRFVVAKNRLTDNSEFEEEPFEIATAYSKMSDDRLIGDIGQVLNPTDIEMLLTILKSNSNLSAVASIIIKAAEL